MRRRQCYVDNAPTGHISIRHIAMPVLRRGKKAKALQKVLVLGVCWRATCPIEYAQAAMSKLLFKDVTVQNFCDGPKNSAGLWHSLVTELKLQQFVW